MYYFNETFDTIMYVKHIVWDLAVHYATDFVFLLYFNYFYIFVLQE